MNTWRDIKAYPPSGGNVVCATDGVSVWCGIIGRTGDLRGINLNDGYHEDVSASDLAQWQPALDTWKPEKSADEMFRELGYTRAPGCVGVYEKGEGSPSGRFARICVGKNSVYKDLVFPAGSVYREPFTTGEILACAQLIREMQNGSD